MVALSQEEGATGAGCSGKRKLELARMRHLIEDMISKGFYQPKSQKPASEKERQEHANEVGAENPEQDGDTPPVQKPLVRLDEESGQLELAKFDIASKPSSVRKLLGTYIEATELIEDL